MQSICLFHNGNKQIVANYIEKFPNLKFSENWILAGDTPPNTGCLWEICHADVSDELLLKARNNNIKIIRHISTYEDDLKNLMAEVVKTSKEQWLNQTVLHNLSWSDEIISDLTEFDTKHHQTIIITTGRTANTHLQQVLRQKNIDAKESSKTLDSDFLTSTKNILLWRKNQWECLTSNWIAVCTDYKYSHQYADRKPVVFEKIVEPIDNNWIISNWSNQIKITLDSAMFSKYILKIPTFHTTTEYITKQFISNQQKLQYDKVKIIPNYFESKLFFENSSIKFNSELAYENVVKHLADFNLDSF